MISSMALVVVVFLWIGLAVRDALFFQIDPSLCAGIAAAWVVFMLAGHADPVNALFGAAIAGGVALILHWRGGFGAGDIYLFVTAGFVLGLSDLVLGGILFGALQVATVGTYAHLRGRSIWRCGAPAAVPAAGAVIGTLTLHAQNMPWGIAQ